MIRMAWHGGDELALYLASTFDNDLSLWLSKSRSFNVRPRSHDSGINPSIDASKVSSHSCCAR